MLCNILTNAQFCGYWRGLRQLQMQLLLLNNVCNLGGLFPFQKRYTVIILSFEYHIHIYTYVFRWLSNDNISNLNDKKDIAQRGMDYMNDLVAL